MDPAARKSMLCPNCRKLISTDEPRCPHCGIKTPGSRIKNNPLTRGMGSGEQLVRAIIYANVAIFIFSLLISKGNPAGGGNPLGMLSPSTRGLAVLGATGTLMVKEVGWWTFISANYLHGGVLHILFNMMAFNQIAPLITRLYGTYRFFTIYTISGIGGFAVSYISGIPITVGASAALCGLIGAAIYYGKSRGGLFGQTIYKQIGGWAMGIVLFGFMIPQINNSAHIGGMVFGALCGYFLGYHEKSREKMPHRILAGVCMVITLLVLLWVILRGVVYLLGG
ncbi:MAG: rhomboid family intramembrane serine protease [Desulfobacteraceae bacterium]